MDFSKMMQEAQKLQKEMVEAQKRIDVAEIEGISGGGLVTVKMTGDGVMRGLLIDDSLLVDKALLEDLLIAAYHDAKKRLEEKREKEMGSLHQSMPKGLGLF